MEIIYNGQNLNTSSLKKIGEGEESNVYQYNDKALKVHNYIDMKMVLQQELCQKLIKLNTKRILLPQGIVYDSNGEYKGYATNYITNVQKLIDVWDNLNLKEEKKYLEEDRMLLSENKIYLQDLSSDGNMLYNGSLYFCDPGSYTINCWPSLDVRNKEAINEALIKNLFLLAEKKEYLEEELIKMTGQYCELSEEMLALILRIYNESIDEDYNNQDFFDFIEEINYEYGSIEQYKIYKIKEAIDSCRFDYDFEYSINNLKRIINI